MDSLAKFYPYLYKFIKVLDINLYKFGSHGVKLVQNFRIPFGKKQYLDP